MHSVRSKRAFRSLAHQTGATLVEFSLVVGLLLILTVGALDFGIHIKNYSAAGHELSLIARELSLGSDTCDLGLAAVKSGIFEPRLKNVAGGEVTLNTSVPGLGAGESCLDTRLPATSLLGPPVNIIPVAFVWEPKCLFCNLVPIDLQIPLGAAVIAENEF